MKLDGNFLFLCRNPRDKIIVVDITIDDIQGLVSKGSSSTANSNVFDIINAGKITEIILSPTMLIVDKKTTYVTILLDVCSLIHW